MKRTIAILVLSATASLGLAGCVVAQPGAMTTDSREIADVEAVALKTSGDVIISVGATPSLTITAGANSLARLTSDVVDGVLVLDATPGPSLGLGDVRYELTVTRIQSIALDGSGDIEADFTGADDITIEISGSGDVEGTNVDAVRLSASIDGSGDIDIAGSTEEQSVSIDGSGEYDASELPTTTAMVDIAGSGSVHVRVTGSLSIDISGSGDVVYSGGASVTQDVSGVGSVREDND